MSETEKHLTQQSPGSASEPQDSGWSGVILGLGLLVASGGAFLLILALVGVIFGFALHVLGQVVSHLHPPYGFIRSDGEFWAIYGLYAAVLAALFNSLDKTVKDPVKVWGAFLGLVVAPLPFFLFHLPFSSTTAVRKGVCGAWLYPIYPSYPPCRNAYDTASGIGDLIMVIGLASPFAFMAYWRWRATRTG